MVVVAYVMVTWFSLGLYGFIWVFKYCVGCLFIGCVSAYCFIVVYWNCVGVLLDVHCIVVGLCMWCYLMFIGCVFDIYFYGVNCVFLILRLSVFVWCALSRALSIGVYWIRTGCVVDVYWNCHRLAVIVYFYILFDFICFYVSCRWFCVGFVVDLCLVFIWLCLMCIWCVFELYVCFNYLVFMWFGLRIFTAFIEFFVLF